MELEYTKNDLKSAFEFGKKNPNSKLKDWFKYEKSQLTKEEKNLFKYIEVATVPINTSKLYFINWNGVGGGHFSEPFQIFKRKYFDKYFPFYNNCMGEFNVIITGYDIFDIEKLDKNKEYEGVYQKEIEVDGAKIMIMNYNDFDGENGDKNFYSWMQSLERNNYHFWQYADWNIYIDDPYKLKTTPALELLEKNNK